MKLKKNYYQCCYFSLEVNFSSESFSPREGKIKSMEMAFRLLFLWERDLENPFMRHSTEQSTLAHHPS